MPRTHTFFERLGDQTIKPWFSGALLVLRVTLGIQFLMSGISKMTDWSAQGFLTYATGPFATFFQSLAGNPLVDFFNVWGMTAIGLALILGLMTRPASFFGMVLMVLYYFAGFEENTAHGLIDFHLIYAFVFVLFMAGGVGHVFGLDGIVTSHSRKRKKFMAVLFG